MQPYDVIVVGAGAAGLTAAQQLVAQGLTVAVLEAQDYAGGRIKSSYDWGQPIELGAEFIHGERTITNQLAQQLNLTTVAAHEDRKLVDQNGRLLEHAQKKVFYELLDYTGSNGRPGVSVQQLIAQNPITTDQTIRRLVANAIGDYEAGDVATLDSGAFTMMYTKTAHNGENVMLLDGYQPIVQRLETGVNIYYNQVVRRIDSSRPDQTAVILADGTVGYARRVLVTVSLGVLQSGYIEFTPGLPDFKRASLNRLSMGNAMKCILRFNNIHDATDLFHIADGENESLQTVTCWWASGNDPHVLVGFCGGERARNALSLEPHRLIQKILIDLRPIAGHAIADDLVDYRISRWDNNRFFMGAYSNHPVGSTDRDNATLAQPTGNLFWAGEATVDNGNYGTVHGAIESGYRAASEISQSLRR